MDEERSKKGHEKPIEERVHQQLIYKDNRIIDLNNVILDKERQILDLQERVREQGEVANVKSQAMRIVQQKFEELNRERRDMATETDSAFLAPSASSSTSSPSTSYIGKSSTERRARSSSPGHIIASRRSTGTGGNFSPPPIDPPVEKDSSFDSAHLDVDGIRGKKNRKRVTFDLPPAARVASTGSTEELETALTEASSENMFLRKQVEELNVAVERMKEQYEEEIAKCTKEAKSAGLRARVVATARIKELESSLETVTGKHANEVELLRAEVDTLRSSRDWELEQNGQYREQVAHLKEKSHKLNEELDVSEKAKRKLDEEAEEAKKTMELMVDDLLAAENIIDYHNTQKEAIFEDVDRLKEAIVAQDRFIEILEADIVIYEQHIGLLRESLGASKIDHRALIKSKAFETKLLALEREKEMIDKKSNEDRLKTKALDKKCRVLVEQNESLMARLCEVEMSRTDNEEMMHRAVMLEDQIRQTTEALEKERDVSEKLRQEKEDSAKEVQRLAYSLEQASQQSSSLQSVASSELQHAPDSQNAAEIEQLNEELRYLQQQAEQLRAENFDLQMTATEAERIQNEKSKDVEERDEMIEELREHVEAHSEELKNAHWQMEELTKRNEAMRLEVEAARRGMKEAYNVQQQVDMLREELDQEREMGRRQWEEACSKLASQKISSRKNSLEVQHEQYMIAYEQKIEKLQKELEDAKTEKEELKTTVEQFKDRETVVEEVVQKTSVETESLSKTPEVEETRGDVCEAFNSDLVESLSLKEAEIEGMRKQIETLELETRLSGELNIELGRAMLELEKQNDLLKHEQQQLAKEEETSKMELRLHEMMVEEMSNEIEEMKTKAEEMDKEKDAEAGKEDDKLTIENLRIENESLRTEMDRVLDQISVFEVARQDEIEIMDQAHSAEIQQLSISIEDARREISDLESKLGDTEEKLRVAHETAETIQVQASYSQASVQEQDSAESVVNLADLDNQRSSENYQSWSQQTLLQTIPTEKPQHRQDEQELHYGNRQPEHHHHVQQAPSHQHHHHREYHQQNQQIQQLEQHQYPQESQNLHQHRQSSPQTSGRITEEANELAEQNTILRQCLDRSTEVQDEVVRDMSRLVELKEELEIAVEALKAEIWSLNGQLKASILDRETLQDRVVQLDTTVEREKKRADGLDVELQEQVEMTEKSQRRAAEAENESNRRLAECLDMEGRREEMEKAYANLTDYYNQLQSAYNAIYAQVYSNQQQDTGVTNEEASHVTASTSSTSTQEAVEGSSSSSSETTTSQQQEILKLIEQLLLVLQILPNEATDTTQKLRTALEKLKKMTEEFTETQEALEEQRRIGEALRVRLETMEAEVGRDANSGRQRVEELEGEIEWKEEECQSLTRRIKELEKALDAISVKANDDEAAKLTTRQADVDSLFRTNAELAHTNVRLQNEVDEKDEQNGELEKKHEEERQTMLSQIAQLEDEVRQLELKLQETTSRAELLASNVETLQSVRVEQTAAQTANHEESAQETEDGENGDEGWGWGEDNDEKTDDDQDAQKDKNDDSEKETEDLKRDIDRLQNIENVLNNRILALEDQLLELEEKVQESEDAVVEERNKNSELEREVNELKKRGERIEKDVKELIEKIQMEKEIVVKERHTMLSQIAQLEDEVRQLELKLQETTSRADLLASQVDAAQAVQLQQTGASASDDGENADEGWGWGEDNDEKTDDDQDAQKNEESEKEKENLKREIDRLQNIENVLNNRILALEDQLLELEEKVQESEDAVAEERNKNSELEKEVNELKKDDLNEIKETVEKLKLEKENIVKEMTAKNERQVEILKETEADLRQELEDTVEELIELKKRIRELEENEVKPSEPEKREEVQVQEAQKAHAQVDDAWGWGEEEDDDKDEKEEENGEDWGWGNEDNVPEVPTTTPPPSASKTVEDDVAKEEISRLRQVEIVLNDRVSALQNQLLGLEMKLQYTEETVVEEKKKLADVETKSKISEQRVQELLLKLEGQQEIVQNLEETISSRSNDLRVMADAQNELREQLAAATSALEEMKEATEAEKQKESPSQVGEENTEQDDGGWNDDGWGEQSDEVKDEPSDNWGWGEDDEDENQKKKKEETIPVSSESDGVDVEKLQELEKELDEWKEKFESSVDEVNKLTRKLEEETRKRDEVIAQLGEELSTVQDELLEANSKEIDSSKLDVHRDQLSAALAERSRLENELKLALEQNGLLKDSEARLIDHADEYATQMEKYSSQCAILKEKIVRLESELVAEKQAKVDSDELVTMRQKLADAEKKVAISTNIVTEKDQAIQRLRREITDLTLQITTLGEQLAVCEQNRMAAVVELLRRKAATVAARQSAAATPAASRPSSRMSTASHVSVTSSASHSQFEPRAVPMPLQSTNSAFESVGQSSLEPLRRRNK